MFSSYVTCSEMHVWTLPRSTQLRTPNLFILLYTLGPSQHRELDYLHKSSPPDEIHAYNNHNGNNSDTASLHTHSHGYKYKIRGWFIPIYSYMMWWEDEWWMREMYAWDECMILAPWHNNNFLKKLPSPVGGLASCSAATPTQRTRWLSQRQSFHRKQPNRHNPS